MNILRALGANVERVIINDLQRGTYYARLVLSAENESQQKKIIKIDARPSLYRHGERAPTNVTQCPGSGDGDGYRFFIQR